MMKTGMRGAGIDEFAQPQLPYPAQALEIRVLDHVIDRLCGDREKPVERIVDDLVFVEGNQSGAKVTCWRYICPCMQMRIFTVFFIFAQCAKMAAQQDTSRSVFTFSGY